MGIGIQREGNDIGGTVFTKVLFIIRADLLVVEKEEFQFLVTNRQYSVQA